MGPDESWPAHEFGAPGAGRTTYVKMMCRMPPPAVAGNNEAKSISPENTYGFNLPPK